MKKASSLKEVASPSQGNPSSSCEAQTARLLAALQSGPKTTFELRHDHNILHPAGRVKALRDRGYSIFTDRIEARDREGNQHKGIGRYVLLECGYE